MELKIGGIYKHFKGGTVNVLFVAKHSDNNEDLVIYQGLENNQYYARPIKSFLEQVTNEQGKVVPRFEFVSQDKNI